MTRSSFGKKAFSFAGALAWRSLPNFVRVCKDYPTFCKLCSAWQFFCMNIVLIWSLNTFLCPFACLDDPKFLFYLLLFHLFIIFTFTSFQSNIWLTHLTLFFPFSFTSFHPSSLFCRCLQSSLWLVAFPLEIRLPNLKKTNLISPLLPLSNLKHSREWRSPLSPSFTSRASATQITSKQTRAKPRKQFAAVITQLLLRSQRYKAEVGIITTGSRGSSARGASSWLTAIPIAEYGFTLHKQAFRDALCIRYGWQPARLPSHCPCSCLFCEPCLELPQRCPPVYPAWPHLGISLLNFSPRFAQMWPLSQPSNLWLGRGFPWETQMLRTRQGWTIPMRPRGLYDWSDNCI